MATETELKLALDPASLVRLRRHEVLRSLKRTRPVTRFQKSVYFDTPDLQLRDSQIALRVRHIGRRRIQTVKNAGECIGGAWARGEWETEISGDTPELHHLAGTEVAGFFADDQLVAALQPVFTSEVRRTIYLLGGEGWEVELAIDEGQLVAAAGSAPIREAELELKSGDARCLYDLALRLQGGISARLLTATKAERGYALVEGGSPQPQKARAVRLSADGTAAEALRAIGRSCVQQLLVNQDCLAETQSPEAVHQMRVAIRRLRSAMNLFKDMLDTPGTAALKEELRWLGGILGAARDTDVFIDEVLTPVAGLFAEEPGFADLKAQFDDERRQHYRQALGILTEPRLTRLLLTLGDWVEGGDWAATEDEARRALLDRPALPLAQAILAKRDRKVHKTLRHMAELPPEERHLGRIEVKKMRYAVEFFASLFSDKKVRKVASALGTLQDQLGLLNDIAVARLRLRERAEETRDASRLWAAGLIVGWHQGRVHTLLDEAEMDLDDYQKLPKFWK